MELYDVNNAAPAVVANPFGSNISTRQDVGTAQVVSHEVAEMQAQIYLAKQFPRDQRTAMDAILTACQRPGLASCAVYSYARGGSAISGPSIRLAEEIARNWGNIECGWNEMERDKDSSKVRAFAWDKESNVLKTMVFIVPHYRTTKQGRRRLEDERDLYELLANQASRRMRNCILALIPGDVVESAVAQCQKTMVTHCDITSESIAKLVEAFSAFGVTKRQIEKRIQRNMESITPAQFVRMREIYTSLRDGMSEPADWFDADEEPTTATESLKNAIKAAKPRAKKQAKPTEQPEVAAPAQQNSSEDDVCARVIAQINSVNTIDELAKIAENVNESGMNNEISAEVYDRLSRCIEERYQTFEANSPRNANNEDGSELF